MRAKFSLVIAMTVLLMIADVAHASWAMLVHDPWFLALDLGWFCLFAFILWTEWHERSEAPKP